MSASGFGTRPSRSATSALTGSGLYATHKTLIFSTEYYFLPEGVKDVFARFKKALRESKLTAEPEWIHESCVFRVRCLRGETQYVPPLFIAAMQSVIRDEEAKNGIHEVDEKDDDSGSDTTSVDGFTTTVADDRVQEGEPIKSTKIQRLDVWKANNTANSITRAQNVSPPAPQGVAHHSSSIGGFCFQEVWFCGAKLHDIIPDITLQQLVELTGCQLVKDLTSGDVHIAGRSEESVRLATLKLDNVHKNWKGVTPYDTHNFYTEETGDFKLSLNYITDVKIHKKRLFQTTLLNNLHTTPAFVHLQNTYSNLSRAITVRCAPFEKNDYTTIRIMKTPPVVENPDQKLASKHWDDFKYNSRGKPSDDPLLQFEDEKPGPLERPGEQLRPNNIQNNDMARVEAWADRVPDMEAQPVSNFFIPPAPLHDAPTPRPAPSQPQTPSWDTSVPYNTEAKTLSGLEKAALVAKAKGSRRPQSNATRSTAIGSSTTASRSTSIALPRSIPPSQSVRATVTPPSSNPADEMLLHTPISVNTPPSPTVFDLSTDLIDLSDLVEPSSSPNPGPVAPTCSRGSDSLQLSNEVSTREFHNTMNQRKPKNPNYKSGPPKPHLPLPSPPRVRQNAVQQRPRLIDPLPWFLSDMNTSFQSLVSNAGLRAFRGRVTIRVEFGRILIRNINPKLISTKDSRGEVLDGERVGNLLGPLPFTGHIQATVRFTNQLTTVPEEIKYLVSMKGSDGTRLWNESSLWEVTYEFIYQERSECGQFFTVEMNAETFQAILTEPRDLGNIYTHGTKRAWDFRIAAFGGERTEMTDQKYGEVVDSLKRSLYIPAKSHEPKLTFELDESLFQKFETLSIRVHRVNKHMSPDGKSYLKIDEVQDLSIRYRPALHKAAIVFDASPQEAELNSIPFQVPNWIEASIHSTKVDKFMSQNEHLELGDEAGWFPEDFYTADAAQALYLPACEMLKQMDGIGYHNEHPKKVQEILSARSMVSETTSHRSNGPRSEVTSERYW